MAYVKTVWETGDVITAEKLNNAEDGIEAAQPFVVHVSFDLDTEKSIMDKTFAEIRSALMEGKNIPVISNAIPEIPLPAEYMGSVLYARESDQAFQVVITDGVAQNTEDQYITLVGFFTTDDEDGYPERSVS